MAKHGQKLHWLKFYPADWLSDPGLQRADAVKRGACIQALCLMFASEKPYCLTVNGEPWPERQICAALKIKRKTYCEILTQKLLRWAPRRGILFSARLLRDHRLRRHKARSGRLGGLAKRKQTSSTTPSTDPSKSLALDARSQKLEEKKEASASSSPNSGEPEKPKEPRKRGAKDDVWDAVCAELGLKPVTRSERKRLGAVVRDLVAKGATGAEVPVRIRRMRKAWGDVPFSPEAVVKWWDQFAKDPPAGKDGKPDTSWMRDPAQAWRFKQEPDQ